MRAVDDRNRDPARDQRSDDGVRHPGGAERRRGRELRCQSCGDGLQAHGLADVAARRLDHASEVGVQREFRRPRRIHRYRHSMPRYGAFF